MAQSESLVIWKNIEMIKTKDQKEILRWQLRAREPILRFSDMKAGDHLVRKNSLGGMFPYQHHFICVGSDREGRPQIIHYYDTKDNGSAKMWHIVLRSSKGFNDVEIQEMTLPHKDFIKSEDELQAKGEEVERVVWPKELRRYSTEEVVKRASRRPGESEFDLVNNNCESFVMWCLCDLNITLQVTEESRLQIILNKALSAYFTIKRVKFL